MTIDEIRKAKLQLEADLAEMIAARVKTFNDETRIPVSGVGIGMYSYTGLDGIFGAYVNRVSVSLETGL
jgi:hypothetical protein